MTDKIAKYEAQAAECRRLAETMRDEAQRTAMLGIEQTWLGMAKRAKAKGLAKSPLGADIAMLQGTLERTKLLSQRLQSALRND